MMMMMCKFVVFYICFFFHLPSSIIIISISILCDLLFSWFQWKHFETHTSSARVWYFLFFFIYFVSYKCMCSAHTHTYRTFTIGFVTNLTIKQSCLEKKMQIVITREMARSDLSAFLCTLNFCCSYWLALHLKLILYSKRREARILRQKK